MGHATCELENHAGERKSMKIHFLGGSDEVGASCILVEMGGQRILVDAGIRVSPKARDGLSGELLPDLSPLNTGKLDAVIITHAHADHIGAIPLVLGSMPEVPVYTTPATISIMSVMFRDALRIMDSRLEAEGELPTYDLLQVQRVETACRPTELRQEFTINGSVNVTFYRAGHIPGAASVFMQADEGSILISGDISFSPMRATPVAEIPPVKPDALLLETTYGGKLHANRRAEEQRLVDSIKQVIDRGGRVLIPAFALGRAQEVALILDAAIAKRKLDPIHVYMDGMTRSITQVFERFPDYLSKGLQKHLEDSLTLFRTDSVKFVKSVKEREALAYDKKPCVIISSSGMLTGGASPFYAQAMVHDAKNAIFITGYQDEESPGRMLQQLAEAGGGTLSLYGKRVQVACEISTYSLSAHADENELTQFAAQLEPERVFLVHGDHMPRERIRDLLRQRKLSVHLPRLGEMVDYTGQRVLGRRKDVPSVPTVVTPPITSLEELDIGLPLYSAEGELYVRNARKAVRKLLPPESGLRKMTFNKNEQVVKFSFDFPLVAYKKYADKIEMVQQMIGWRVEVNEGVNMQALNTVARQLLPDMIGRASIHMAQAVTEVKLKNLPENWKALQEQYQGETGFRLLIKGAAELLQTQHAVVQSIRSAPITPVVGKKQVEINEAYAILRMTLRDSGMYKSGLKNGVIVLSFTTPELGYELKDKLEELSNRTGYPLDIHPHPNQHNIIDLVNGLCNEKGIYLVKNPSLKISEQTVVIEPMEILPDDVAAELQQRFHEQTRWKLEVKESQLM